MMGVTNVPASLRILLLIASVLSFAPQLYLTISRRSSTGISTRAVLFNLISVTEQFALTFFFIVGEFEDPDVFVHSPRNSGDWINLAQMGVLLILWLIFFVVCIYFPCYDRDFSVVSAIATYISFFFISVVPVLTDAINPGPSMDRKWIMAIFFGVHSLFLSWIISALNIAAIYSQVKETHTRPENKNALSRIGLAAQAIVFTIMAISWVGRVRFPYEGFKEYFWALLPTWYELVGWAAIDTGIFAIGQAFILWKVSRQASSTPNISDRETEPLLSA